MPSFSPIRIEFHVSCLPCGFKRLNLAEMASLPAVYLEFCRKAHPEAVLDCHLMIVEPEQRVEDFAKAGADIISVHCEAPGHLHGEGRF